MIMPLASAPFSAERVNEDAVTHFYSVQIPEITVFLVETMVFRCHTNFFVKIDVDGMF